MLVSRCRDEQEFRQFYDKYATKDIANCDWLLEHTDYVFCFYEDEMLGCIYLDGDDEGRVCLNGFSKPKQMDKVIEAINFVSDFMHLDDLYSHTERKCAIIVLLRCGFKKLKDNLLYRKAY